MRDLALCLAAVMTLHACPPSPAPPSPDASDAAPALHDAAPPAPIEASTAAAAACANLARLGCSEGVAANCGAVIDVAIATRITTVNLPCLTTATSKTAAQACGFVRCP